MRLSLASLLAVAACGRTPVPFTAENRTGGEVAASAAAAPAHAAATRAFEPTAFSVEVRGHGRPVILIPGLGCPSSVWTATAAHLDGYEVHALQLAGFAGKPRIDGPLARTTVEELARYIRDRHLVSPVIIGHSLGGFVAYWLAAREPELVGPTIVVDAGAQLSIGDGDNQAAAAAQVRAMWRDAGDQQFAQQVRDVFGQMSAKPERLAPMLAEVARSDRRAIGDAIYELSVTTVRDQLGKIRAPVLLVLADGSLQDSFRRQAETVRDREVIVVPGAGHFVMLDEPDAFFAAVDGFLARHGQVARR
jgi:pimeloyl-ACP methyl ester carboxylesterase